jgi:hypothetical protein
MEPDCPCNIPLKAGNTYAHVSGITPLLQERSEYPDKGSNRNNPRPSRKEILELSHAFLVFNWKTLWNRKEVIPLAEPLGLSLRSEEYILAILINQI